MGAALVSLTVAAAGGCGNDGGQSSQTALTAPSTEPPGPDMSHLEAMLLEEWADLEEASSRSLGESDLGHYGSQDGSLTGGYERVFTDGASELTIVLVELPEGTRSSPLLESMVDAWSSNPNLVSSEEVDVPGLPEARGLRFESAIDYVRAFGASDGVAVDVSVRAQASDQDALDMAAEVLEAQLARL